MLQLTFGLPFWQCPVPSTLSFTEVNAAALTANAFGTTNSAAAAAATIVASLNAVHRRRRAPPESLLFIPAPPSSGSTWCARRCRDGFLVPGVGATVVSPLAAA